MSAAFRVTDMLHRAGCEDCHACADFAETMARTTGSIGASYSNIVGTFRHSATVERVRPHLTVFCGNKTVTVDLPSGLRSGHGVGDAIEDFVHKVVNEQFPDHVHGPITDTGIELAIGKLRLGESASVPL